MSAFDKLTPKVDNAYKLLHEARLLVSVLGGVDYASSAKAREKAQWRVCRRLNTARTLDRMRQSLLYKG